jgi:mRNA interferase YafQ
MRVIKKLTAFRKDIKRESKGPNLATLNSDLPVILALLADGKPLPDKYQDHPLSGKWINHRECHIRPDLLLIYHKQEDILTLSRLGSHSELFGL